MDQDDTIDGPLLADRARPMLLRDVEGRLIAVGLEGPDRRSEVETSRSSGLTPVRIDLGRHGSLRLLPIVATAANSSTSYGKPAYQPTDAQDRDAGRRLLACLMCDVAHVPQGCKAIGRFLHACWTADLVPLFGPVPKGRTVRLWRATRGRPLRRSAADMTSAQGRSRSQSRLHPSVDAMLDRFFGEAANADTTAIETHRRLIETMDALEQETGDRHRRPSLSTVTRRMRAARLRRARRTCTFPEPASDHSIDVSFDQNSGS